MTGRFSCVKGNTWCMDTRTTMIGVYRLDGRDVVLLDSGSAFQPDESASVMGALEQEGLNVKAVIATHAHWDHIGNNKRLVEKYGCEIYMYGEEAYISRDVDSLRYEWPPVPFREMRPLLERMQGCPTVFIEPGAEEVRICGRRFGILHTPGHSRSHITIITEDNVAMVGDAVMAEQTLLRSKLPYAENIAVDFESKKKLAALGCDRYILSHKGLRDDLREEAEKGIAYIEGRAEAVAQCVRAGMNYEDIVAAVIRGMRIRITCRFDYADIHGMVAPYVRYLEESGRLETWYEEGYLRYRVK